MVDKILIEDLLINVLQSGKPCPSCVSASSEPPQSFTWWESSTWGLPGSPGRICNGNCHCVLIPVDTLEKFPEIKDLNLNIKLRGDKGSDIGKVIDIFPQEKTMIDLIVRYEAQVGKLPKGFYYQTIPEAIVFLRNALKGGG